MSLDADDPIAAAATHVGNRHAVADICSGGDGRVDEHWVEHGAARGEEGIDASRRLDHDGDIVVRVMEGRAPDRGSPGVDDPIEETPAMEL